MGMLRSEAAGLGDGSLTSRPGQSIWKGLLHVHGHRKDIAFPCVAVRYPKPSRPSVVDAGGWPQHLHCDSTKLKRVVNVFQYMNKPGGQWYVRFAAIDGNGAECQHLKLVQLVKVMIHRQLAFEIHCGTTGMLYLWGIQMPPHGYSLFGVFRPSAPSTLA